MEVTGAVNNFEHTHTHTRSHEIKTFFAVSALYSTDDNHP